MKSKSSQDLLNLRLRLNLIRQNVNRELDELSQKIDALLPARDETRYHKLKNYVPQDWRNYLKLKGR